MRLAFSRISSFFSLFFPILNSCVLQILMSCRVSCIMFRCMDTLLLLSTDSLCQFVFFSQIQAPYFCSARERGEKSSLQASLLVDDVEIYSLLSFCAFMCVCVLRQSLSLPSSNIYPPSRSNYANSVYWKQNVFLSLFLPHFLKLTTHSDSKAEAHLR